MWKQAVIQTSNKLLFSLVPEYTIKQVQETAMSLNLNDIQQVLAYYDDVDLMLNGIRVMERNANALLNIYKEICSELNFRKY